MSAKRKVIVGLDGMPYGLMARFGHDGTMPNFGALAGEGIFRQMSSSIPEVSSVAWSSIITGVNPGEHGIYGFTDIAPGTYRRTFSNFGSLCVEPFWEREGSGPSVIVNVPTTYPAREMNGVLIAGFVALDLERATFPRSLVPRLQAMDYRVDVDSQKAPQSLEFFVRDLHDTLEARIATYRSLWHREAWNTFVLVFTGTDRLAHFLWDAYQDENHKHHQSFLDHFRRIDEVIGEIAQNLESGDSLYILSDHGFERLEQNIHVNYLLVEGGFLSFEDGASPSLRAISDKARAFALDPGRIHVNLRGKYPRGSVDPADRTSVVRDLEAYLGPLEIGGQSVVKCVYRGEELYNGRQAHRAPDLVLLGNNGFNLRANVKATRAFGTDIFTGKHSQADAFLLASGDFESDIVPEELSVCDIVHIMDSL
jgi:predicted AlkP superfamily phosphohydrolase/phosphomutase